MASESRIHSNIRASQVEKFNAGLAAVALDSMDNVNALRDVGIDLSKAMDAIQSTVTSGTVAAPVQMLQHWAQGMVRVLTKVRNADALMGIQTVGGFEDEEVVQMMLEQTGKAVPYGDKQNAPYASWNPAYERRTVVRFEKGFEVDRLEEMRASRIRVNSAEEKRGAAALALEIERNRVGFNGFVSGNNRTYGFLNDPSLPAYVTAAATGTGSTTTWSTKSFLNITADIRTAVAALRTQAGGNINPDSTPMILALPLAAVDYLSVTSDFGVSVRDWLTKTFPRITVQSAPELDGANGGANVFYLYAERVDDGSSDGGDVWAQFVPTRSLFLGTHVYSKGFREDYANATAGAMLKRPYAVVRYTGI